jgi:prepilin-type N-terminal cleavage/methylation domain-containing protein
LDLRWGFETTSVKTYTIQRSQHGFTLIEIVVVLILMAIISAYVIGRSVTTDRVDVTGQTDRIRNQIRFAQSNAMKRSDSVWGITCDGTQYWMFSGSTATPEVLPGENNSKITLSDLGIGMNAFTLFFDRIGRPYKDYTDEDNNTPLDDGNNTPIVISAEGQNRTITIEPETGLPQ